MFFLEIIVSDIIILFFLYFLESLIVSLIYIKI